MGEAGSVDVDTRQAKPWTTRAGPASRPGMTSADPLRVPVVSALPPMGHVVAVVWHLSA
jgi:hypothetical protein